MNVNGATPGPILGTTQADNANSGIVGEYISSSLSIGSAVTLTTLIAKDVTTISLTPGYWDVFGYVYWTPGASTSWTDIYCSISGTTNTLNFTVGRYNTHSTAANVPGANDFGKALAPYRLSLATTTTVYLVAFATFSVSTMKAYGYIAARRMR